jgi:glycosyltransferase involved in cell wall biosynthesis
MSTPTVAVVGPLPPPIHGHMVLTRRILGSRRLACEFRIVHVDSSDHRGFENLGRFDLANVVLAIRHGWRLLVTLARERPAIVYVPLSQNILGLGRDLAFVALGLAARSLVIGHVHGGGFRTFLEDAPAWFRAAARALLRRTATLVAMSEWQRERVAAAIPGCRAVVVPHGTEILETPPRLPESHPLRALYVSSYLDESKGLQTVLEAASEAQRAGITSTWDIVGAPTNGSGRRPGVEPLAATSGIHFRGALEPEELRRAYASADVFVFPTQANEGFGFVRIEAMAAGLPVITTEAGGAREIVRDGIDGFIVEYDSPGEIVNRLAELEADPERRAEMGRRAQERQRARFSEESFERGMASVWREVAAGRARASARATHDE